MIEAQQVDDGGFGPAPPQYHIPIPSYNKEDVLLQILDNTKLLETIEYVLRGWARNRKTGEWEPRIVGYATDENGVTTPVHQPLMNEIGISRIMAFFESQVDKVTQASNLGIDDVNRLSEEAGLWILEQLYLNCAEWDIRKEEFGTIVTIVDQTNYKICRQAMNNGLRDLIGKITMVNENIEHTEKKKNALFNLFG